MKVCFIFFFSFYFLFTFLHLFAFYLDMLSYAIGSDIPVMFIFNGVTCKIHLFKALELNDT